MTRTDLAADRKAELRRAQLGGLMADAGVGRQLSAEAGLCAAIASDGRAWVLLSPDGPSAGLGAAVAWATRHDASGLRIFVDGDSAALARQAAYLRLPTQVDAVKIRRVIRSTPSPLPVPPDPPTAHTALIPRIEAAGLDATVEHGVVAGEVRGLEICRVVDDAETGRARIDVGVGAADRELFGLLHADRVDEAGATVAALTEVAAQVRPHRRLDAPPHPLNALSRSRLWRAEIADRPALIGASRLDGAPPPTPRRSLRDPAPCVAVATIAEQRVTVVFSTGVDLDVALFAADARAALDTPDVVVVMPRRDALPVQERIASQLRRPPRIIGLDDLA